MQDLFFYSSKVVWMLIAPDRLFLLLLLICLLALLTGRQRLARNLLIILTAIVCMLSFIRVGDMMLYPLEARFQHNPPLPKQVDGIIVLGGSVITVMSAQWQQLETNSSHERLSSFIQLAQRYPDAQLVFTGGNGSLDRDRPTEGDLVRDYLISSGISADRLVVEKQSRNTAENVNFSKRLMQPKADENWLLITTASHMPRSIGLFCQQGWPAIAYPVDHYTNPDNLFSIHFSLMDNANNLVLASYEWMGLLAYYLTGKIDAILPRNCR